MLCLCPNHHAQLDSYAYYIETKDKGYEIVGLKDFAGKRLTVSSRHKLGEEYLKYQKTMYEKSDPRTKFK